MINNYIEKKIFFIFLFSCILYTFSKSNTEVFKGDMIATIQWLYRMENKLETINNVEDKIESYQAILDLNKKALEDRRFIKNCALLVPSVVCFSFASAVMATIGFDYLKSVHFRSHDDGFVLAAIASLYGLGFFVLWNFDRKNTNNCIEANKRIINKLQQLRNKFDAQRALWKAKMDLATDKYVYNFI